jgi:hypothetical protein
MAALERIKTGIAKEEPADDPAPPAGPTGPSIPIDPGVTGAGLMRVIRSYLGPKWARSIWNPSKR